MMKYKVKMSLSYLILPIIAFLLIIVGTFGFCYGNSFSKVFLLFFICLICLCVVSWFIIDLLSSITVDDANFTTYKLFKKSTYRLDEITAVKQAIFRIGEYYNIYVNEKKACSFCGDAKNARVFINDLNSKGIKVH